MLCVCFLQDDDDGRKVITLTDLARIEIFVKEKILYEYTFYSKVNLKSFLGYLDFCKIA